MSRSIEDVMVEAVNCYRAGVPVVIHGTDGVVLHGREWYGQFGESLIKEITEVDHTAFDAHLTCREVLERERQELLKRRKP